MKNISFATLPGLKFSKNYLYISLFIKYKTRAKVTSFNISFITAPALSGHALHL